MRPVATFADLLDANITKRKFVIDVKFTSLKNFVSECKIKDIGKDMSYRKAKKT
jgi:hypothetical protein